MSKAESSLRIVSTSGDRIQISGAWDGKPATYYICKKNPGSRGAIRLETQDGKSAGNLGMHRSKSGESQCVHHARLVSLLFKDRAA